MRAVIYTRVSVDREDQTSTATQAREAKAWCKERGITVVDTFEELGRSAFKGEPRPELENAISMLERHDADLLVVWKLDRLTRSVADSHDILSRITKADADFVSVKEPMLTTDLDTNPMGGMLIQMFVTLAEIESRNIRLRIQPWHDKRLEDGAIPVGPAPYGYTKTDADGVTVRNQLRVDEAQAQVVREMAALLLAGDSMRSVAARYGMHHQSARRIMTNPTLAAMRELPDGQLQESDQWLPILDVATLMALRDLLLDPSRGHGKSRALKWMLSGLATCTTDGCEGRIITHQQHGETRYMCSGCNVSVQAQLADDFVSHELLTRLDDVTWAEMQARGRTADISQVKHLSETLAMYRDEVDMGLMSHDEYRGKRDKLTARITELQQADAVSLPNIESVQAAWATMDVRAKQLVLNAAFARVAITPAAKGHRGVKRIVIDVSDAMA